MKINAQWLTSAASQAVCRMLTDAGYQAWFVGGCVRNELIDAPVSDLDLSTNARPEVVIQLAKAAGVKPIPTGIEHGTVTVVADGVPYEITTFRKDVETDGRRAVVAFADSMEEDAHRRDFTMNALYVGSDGVVVDPLGGLPDLEARRVRFIDDADARIREDYLRILRFFRFHAWYGDADEGLDADGLAACASNAEGIAQLSKERIGHEVRKLLAAPDPAPAVASMQTSGILNRVIAGAHAAPVAILVHHEGVHGLTIDPITRLAALGGEEAPAVLRLSNADKRRYEALLSSATGAQGPSEIGYRLGAELAKQSLALRAALFERPLDERELSAAVDGSEQTFPVVARDLMPRFEGAELGAKLKELETAWIASGFTASQATLLDQA